ncbi:hypothetical protein HY449_01470 [Candidatus Pacearchaeota archaeon]|nr:hypothetical protein [Candidatus Pacearchaeota archaeon]
MKILRNKTGADKILSVYWFAMLFVIASGIFAIVYVFYLHPFDVREIETAVLTGRIAECVSTQGIFDDNFLSDDSGKNFISKECHLNFNSEFDKIQYYVEIEIYDFKAFESSSNPMKKISDGNENLKADCELQKTKNNNLKLQSKCSEKSIYSIDKKNVPYIIKILSVVRKTEKNAV